ncbi:hypothetical protein TRVA0_034S01068 [Trichomonascus vanleenenianus]|uniref:triglyceride lipase n=1 Tax=Trichomonascus vanleenenianus TaxID=2268995 RepID=UPI003EC97430
MTFLVKKRCIVDGNWPRFNDTCVRDPSIPLKVVYNVYSDPRPEAPANNQGDLAPEARVNFVFTHGNGMGKEIWEWYVERLFEQFGSIIGTVVTWDIANHGESYALNKDNLGWAYPWQEGAWDLLALLKSLRLPGSTVLIGHSMGGTFSLIASALQPGLVDSVIVLDPVSYRDVNKIATPEMRNAMRSMFAKAEKQLIENFKSKDEYMKYMTTRGIARKFHPAFQKSFLEGAAVERPDGTVSFSTPTQNIMSVYYSSSSVVGHAVYKYFDLVPCEVLYLAPDKDGFNPLISSELAVKHLKHCTFAEIDTRDHLFPFTLPDQVFAKMAPFIRRRAARGAAIQADIVHRARLPGAEWERLKAAQFTKLHDNFPEPYFPHSKL